MHNEFTAVIEQDGEWYIGYCPEIPGANGLVTPSTNVGPASRMQSN